MDTTAQPYYRKMASTLAEGIRNGQYGIGDSLPTERELFVDLFNTQDQREGVNAFLEKRAPNWKNA